MSCGIDSVFGREDGRGTLEMSSDGAAPQCGEDDSPHRLSSGPTTVLRLLKRLLCHGLPVVSRAPYFVVPEQEGSAAGLTLWMAVGARRGIEFAGGAVTRWNDPLCAAT